MQVRLLHIALTKRGKMYKIIIAGSRDFHDYELLKIETNNFIDEYKATLNSSDDDSISIISGHARGADKLGEQYAQAYNHFCYIMPADWDKYGKRAGYLRNADMAKKAHALIAFWDGQSRGTYHMIELAKKENLKVKVVTYKD